MPTRLDVLDICVLSLVGTVWLVVPAHLEAMNAPFAEVSRASLVEMPIVLALAASWCFLARTRMRSRQPASREGPDGRVLFFGFSAFFCSLIDDGPVGFDSVFTWPEVTSGAQHVFLEVVLHLLTLGFLLLAARSALGGSRVTRRSATEIYLLLLASFWASYAQNTPFLGLQTLPTTQWYYLDAVEHVVALALFLLAIRLCLALRRDLAKGQVKETGSTVVG